MGAVGVVSWQPSHRWHPGGAGGKAEMRVDES